MRTGRDEHCSGRGNDTGRAPSPSIPPHRIRYASPSSATSRSARGTGPVTRRLALLAAVALLGCGVAATSARAQTCYEDLGTISTRTEHTTRTSNLCWSSVVNRGWWSTNKSRAQDISFKAGVTAGYDISLMAFGGARRDAAHLLLRTGKHDVYGVVLAENFFEKPGCSPTRWPEPIERCNSRIRIKLTQGNWYTIQATRLGYGTTDGVGNLKLVVKPDTTPPSVVAASHIPAANATNVATGTNIGVTFNERVKKGTGNIILSAPGTTALTIPVTDPRVVVSDMTVSSGGEPALVSRMMVFPGNDNRLLPGKRYTATIKASAIIDGFDRPMASDATWVFDTVSLATCYTDLGLVTRSAGKSVSTRTSPLCDASSGLTWQRGAAPLGAKSRFFSFQPEHNGLWRITVDATDPSSWRNHAHLVLREGAQKMEGATTIRQAGSAHPQRPAILWHILDSSKTYTIEASRNGWASRNPAGEVVGGAGAGRITVSIEADNTPPVRQVVSPANGARNVTTGQVMVVTFDETVEKGIDFSTKISIAKNNTTIMDVPFNKIRFAGRTVTIDLGEPLDMGTNYQVAIPSVVSLTK